MNSQIEQAVTSRDREDQDPQAEGFVSQVVKDVRRKKDAVKILTRQTSLSQHS